MEEWTLGYRWQGLVVVVDILFVERGLAEEDPKAEGAVEAVRQVRGPLEDNSA